MRALIAFGDNLPEDDVFWSKGGEGANVFEFVDKVNVEDEDFGGGGADSQGEDSVDTDFDEPEDPTLDTEVGEEPEEVKKKKKNVYVDPKRKRGSRKRKKESDTEEDEQPNKRREKLLSYVPVLSTDRKLRQSTIEITKERELQREIELLTPSQKRERKVIKKFSQEYLLSEAKETEKKNLQSYAEMKKIEDDKKKVVIKKNYHKRTKTYRNQ